MGDAAGELTDDFHFLRLLQAFQQFLGFGDVLNGAGSAHFAVFGAASKGALKDMANATVGADNAVLKRIRLT